MSDRVRSNALRVFTVEAPLAKIASIFAVPELRLPRLRVSAGNTPHILAALVFLFVTLNMASVGLQRSIPAFNPFSASRGFALPASDAAGDLLSSYLGTRPEQREQGFNVSADSPRIDTSAFELLSFQEYTVRPGDTISGIAERFGLNMDTILSFNQISDVRRMQVGRSFTIPSRDGLRHIVQSGETLSGIAGSYSSSVNAVLDANDLDTAVLQAGQELFIPDARMRETELKLILGELFVYPTVGRFTSGFGMRRDPFAPSIWQFHNGVDWANVVGTPIRAAMAGTVVHIESQTWNYGKHVVVRHPEGFQTLYAHLDSFAVREGQYVSQGQILGRMGNTGKSTGPHLHFSIIRNGSFVDPLDFLH